MSKEISQEGTLKLELPHNLRISTARLETVAAKFKEFHLTMATLLGVKTDELSCEFQSPKTNTNDPNDALPFFRHYGLGLPSERILLYFSDGRVVDAKVLDWCINRGHAIEIQVEPFEFVDGERVIEIYRILSPDLGGCAIGDKIPHWCETTESNRSCSAWPNISRIEFK